jgi:hypothetical protein
VTAIGRAIMPTNPFCTRHVRPGAIPYIFPAGESAQQLVERLRENAWRGEIIGPHGSGKSTLVESLVPELRRAGVRPVVIAIHDWSRRLPADWSQTLVRARSVLVIDGFEQLPWFARAWVKLRCRLLRCGLIVTAHQPMGLPLLMVLALVDWLWVRPLGAANSRRDCNKTSRNLNTRFTRRVPLWSRPVHPRSTCFSANAPYAEPLQGGKRTRRETPREAPEIRHETFTI